MLELGAAVLLDDEVVGAALELVLEAGSLELDELERAVELK